jgi:quercetin dioxygenase-like cupin family protein
MSDAAYKAFEAESLAAGFDEVLVREWTPGLVLDTHTHPFAVSARVVAGAVALSAGGATAHLRAGDRFELEREAPHAERYGPEGATFWVARRHAR